jgi:nitrate reductase NapE component
MEYSQSMTSNKGMIIVSKTKKINFNEFMNGDYKVKEKEKKQRIIRKTTKLATSAILPIATLGAVGTLGFAMTALAATTNTMAVSTTPIAVEVTAKEWMSQEALSTLAHILDPIVDILVALSFPIASVIIVGSCFQFMFDRADKGWTMIQNAGLGYVLIQVSPLILNVLKQVGNAV